MNKWFWIVIIGAVLVVLFGVLKIHTLITTLLDGRIDAKGFISGLGARVNSIAHGEFNF